MIRGDDVERLQQLLAENYGELLGDDGIDGVFGKNTDKAVMAFQTDNNLPVTGRVTSLEWALLNGVDTVS